MAEQLDRISRRRVDKFEERRGELAEAALKTLSEIGYAKASLREIAQNSQFSHGVLHYYFSDKIDLIICSVRQYKAQCVTRYDAIISKSTNFEDFEFEYLGTLVATIREEPHLHRLWFDLRSQALFEKAFQKDVAAIEESLKGMVARVSRRLAELAGRPLVISDEAMYCMTDGLFQRCLLRHLSGDAKAIDGMKHEIRRLIRLSLNMPLPFPAPVTGSLGSGPPAKPARTGR